MQAAWWTEYRPEAQALCLMRWNRPGNVDQVDQTDASFCEKGAGFSYPVRFMKLYHPARYPEGGRDLVDGHVDIEAKVNFYRCSVVGHDYMSRYCTVVSWYGTAGGAAGLGADVAIQMLLIMNASGLPASGAGSNMPLSGHWISFPLFIQATCTYLPDLQLAEKLIKTLAGMTTVQNPIRLPFRLRLTVSL